MAITNTLRARLEVLGGKELVDIFDKIGDSGKKAFDKVDKEAKEATREVKKLEKELKALDRIARDIRAKIRIDKTGVATPQQRASLDLADDIDRRAAAMRRQIAAMDDVMALGPEGGTRILGKQADRDLLTIRDTTRGLDELIANGRRDGVFGDLIPDADLDRIVAAAERIRVENDRFFDNINERARINDEAERTRPPVRPKKDPSVPDPEAEAKRQAAEEARIKREQEREQRIKDAQDRRAEQAARDAKRDQDYRDNMVRERKRIDDEITRSREKLRLDLEENRKRLQRDIDAQRTRLDAERTTLNEQMARERQTFRDELTRARTDHTDEVNRLNRRHADAMSRLQRDHNDVLRRERADHLRTMATERARARAQLGRERATFTSDLSRARADHVADLARDRAAFASQLTTERTAFARRMAAEQSSNRSTLLSERAAHARAMAAERGVFARDMANERAMHMRRLTADRAEITRLNNDLQALRRAFAGINRGGRRFAGAAPGIGSMARGLGRAFSDGARGIGRFGAALKQLEYAVGNTALRGAVGGLLGVLGGGLAALGGAAVLGGISAIAVLASFNAQKLENAAAAVGQALDSFTAMKYAAGSSGVNFDDYLAGAQALRTAMIGIMKQDEQFAGAADLFKRGGIPLLTSDGKDLASQFHVLRRMADLIKLMPNDNVRIEFLTNIGGPELAKLLPMLQDGAAGIDNSARRAIELGVVLTKEQVIEMEKLKAQVYDMWQILIGLSYKLAKEIMPSLIPVLESINAWMLKNEDAITNGLVKTFNYLIRVTKDFWALWNDRKNVFDKGFGDGVETKWAVTFVYATAVIIRALQRVWNAITIGYELAKPVLTKIADLFGMSGPLEVALTFLAGQLLGISALMLGMAKVGAAAVGLVANALRNLLLPIASRVLGAVVGIIGWPLLLAAGITALVLYWDDVEKLFTWAWAAFKRTFPNTAALLEDAFGDALAKVKSFTGETLAEFQKRFPGITKLFEDTRDSLDTLWDSIKGFNWGLVFEGISDIGMYMLRNLVESLETLSPILDYFVKNTLQSLATILNSISWFLTSAKEYGKDKGEMGVELDMGEEEYRSYKAFVGTTALDRIMGGHPIYDLGNGANSIKALTDRASMQSPVSAATELPQNTAPAAMTPVNVNLSNGDTIIMLTPEDNVPERLSSYAATRAAASPGWNR
ncbi:MAG: hypothetical protein ACK4ZU_03940 [Allorhizobium sp.]